MKNFGSTNKIFFFSLLFRCLKKYLRVPCKKGKTKTKKNKLKTDARVPSSNTHQAMNILPV